MSGIVKSMYEPIDWLEQARLDFYEETKDMSSDEVIRMVHQDTMRIVREYDMTNWSQNMSRVYETGTR